MSIDARNGEFIEIHFLGDGNDMIGISYTAFEYATKSGAENILVSTDVEGTSKHKLISLITVKNSKKNSVYQNKTLFLDNDINLNDLYALITRWIGIFNL